MPPGRPRNFNRDVALERAMELFWARGYEGAQLVEIAEVMGINPPSFYAAFGSKEAAFREALELYERKMGDGWIKAFGDDLDARQSIQALLEYVIDVALAAPGSGGCMVFVSMINAMPSNTPLSDLLRNRRREAFGKIRERLEGGVRDGDLPPSTHITRLANFIYAIVQSISLQARDGATRKELEDIVGTAMMAMPNSGHGPLSSGEAPSARRGRHRNDSARRDDKMGPSGAD